MNRLLYGSVQANGIKIQYYRTGEEKPPVVMLHGLCDSGLCWNYLAIALEPRYDIVLMDARGHGLSEKTESGYAAHEQVADVSGLIAALELEQPVVIGHSMGAVSAAMLAGKYPELIKCLILEDPPIGDTIWGDPLTDYSQRAREWRSKIENYKKMTLDEIMQDCQVSHPSWDSSEVFLWAKAKQLVSPNAAKFIEGSEGSWRELLASITCPTLIITGDTQSGAIVNPETLQEALQILPNGHTAHINGAGHNIRRDQYSPYYNAIRTFLRKYGRTD